MCKEALMPALLCMTGICCQRYTAREAHFGGCRCQRRSAALTGSTARTAMSAPGTSRTFRTAAWAVERRAVGLHNDKYFRKVYLLVVCTALHGVYQQRQALLQCVRKVCSAITFEHHPCRFEGGLDDAQLEVRAHEAQQVVEIGHRQEGVPRPNQLQRTQRYRASGRSARAQKSAQIGSPPAICCY